MDGFGGRQAEAGAALANACEALAQQAPAMSAKRVLTQPQLWTFLAFAALTGCAFAFNFDASLEVLRIAALVMFAGLLGLRLAAAASGLFPQRTPPVSAAPLPILTVLCPLYKEAAVAPDLVAALARLDYPHHLLDVKLILEADDTETCAAVTALELPPYCEVLVVPSAAPRTKPKALNYALAFAVGDIVTVFDAEDRPHPGQLRAAAAAFAAGGPGLACVQAPLFVDNPKASWIAQQFAAEYAVQFAAFVPFFARFGLPFPLGGTSNYFRASALRECGAWDPYNVTEDADIGYRLARAGYRLGYIPLPTYEEAPVTLGAWRRQRTRWIKGHVQTWLVLMRRPVTALRELGLPGFLAFHAALGGGILAAFLHGPMAIWLLSVLFAPAWALHPLDAAVALAGYATGLLAILAGAGAAGQPALMRAALTAPLYWPLASWAALCSLGELLLKPHYWAKTTHGLSTRGPSPHVRPAPHALRFLQRSRSDGGEPSPLSHRALD